MTTRFWREARSVRGRAPARAPIGTGTAGSGARRYTCLCRCPILQVVHDFLDGADRLCRSRFFPAAARHLPLRSSRRLRRRRNLQYRRTDWKRARIQLALQQRTHWTDILDRARPSLPCRARVPVVRYHDARLDHFYFTAQSCFSAETELNSNCSGPNHRALYTARTFTNRVRKENAAKDHSMVHLSSVNATI